MLLEEYAHKLDSPVEDCLRRVFAVSQHMRQLIHDLLDLSRVRHCEMVRETVDLSASAHTIAAQLQEAQPERQVEFRIADRVVAQGDARLLRVVLENLLANSWKFTSKHPCATIEFGVTEQNGRPAYFVRDDGVGFNMTHANKLFGPFQRLHRMNEFPGTGIGLATVQRIIHRHDGCV